MEEAHRSTAIEGSTLVLKQVETLLAEGCAVGNKQLREYLLPRTRHPPFPGGMTPPTWVEVPAAMADWGPGGLAHPAQRVAGRTLEWRGSELEPKGASRCPHGCSRRRVIA